MKSILTSLRDVPGFLKHPNSDCRYVESSSAEAFGAYFRQIAPLDPKNLPSAGGLVNERVEIKLPTGESFFGITYGGDLDGWRTLIENHARVSGVRYGRIDGESLVLSDGSIKELTACEIVQH